MLGLGRASEYAGWWNTGGPVVIDIDVATAVSQAAYQTPVFTWNMPTPTAGNNGPVWRNASTGYVDVSGYTSLTGYNALRSTVVSTFKLPWIGGLTSSTQVSYLYVTDNNTADYTFGSQLGINGSGNLTMYFGNINGFSGIGSNTITLPGAYTTWTSTWFTLVFSTAETSSVFSDWSAVGSGAAYVRLAIYNAQTGVLISKSDSVVTTVGGDYPNVTDYITNSGGSIYLDSSSNYALRWDVSGQSDDNPITKAQDWISIGTMFDPVGTKSTDSTWLTTRPNNTIGTASAWVNQQWVEYENVSNTWFLTDTAGDRVTGATNDRQNSFVAAGNVTIFNNNYSTTNIPKDTS